MDVWFGERASSRSERFAFVVTGVDFGCGEMDFGAVMLLRRPDAVRTWGYAGCGEAVFFHQDW